MARTWLSIRVDLVEGRGEPTQRQLAGLALAAAFVVLIAGGG